MKIYLAARYSRRDQLRSVAGELRRLGHTITSSWLNTDFPIAETGSSAAPPELRERHACQDYEDVFSCEWFINFTEDPSLKASGRGGRHVEFGIALAAGKRLIVVGHRENIFHHLPQVEWFASQWDMVRALGSP